MLNQLHELIIECSGKWWKFLLAVIVQVGALLMLQRISSDFPEVSGGSPPFDMQNTLQPDQIFEQLTTYTQQAFDLYTVFQVIDFIFPLAASLVIASACAFLLRNISAKIYQKIYSRKLFLLLLVPAGFDYLENIFLFWTVRSWPEQADLAATLAVAAKLGKLGTMTAAFALTGILVVMASLAWVLRRIRTYRSSDSDQE
jgi:hypothetical protein